MSAPHPALVALVAGEALPRDFAVDMPVVESAVEHGLAPLLHEAVENNRFDGDHDAKIRLATWSLRCTAETDLASSALSVVLDAADAMQLDLALFKGQAIARRWYPRPDLRPAEDVDLFINPSQTEHLGEFIAKFDPRIACVAAAFVADGRRFDHSVLVEGVAIDLHTDPVKLVVTARQRHVIWDRTEDLALPGDRSVAALDLELSLIHALVNLVRDNFADLLHVYDVRLMLDAAPDWRFIVDFIEEEGWTDIVRFSLGFVCDVLGRQSPLPRTTSRSNAALIASIWPDRILNKGSDSVRQTVRRQALLGLLISGRRWDAARALAGRILPPRSLIDLGSGDSTDSYPAALYRWRRAQRVVELPHQPDAVDSDMTEVADATK